MFSQTSFAEISFCEIIDPLTGKSHFIIRAKLKLDNLSHFSLPMITKNSKSVQFLNVVNRTLKTLRNS